MKTTRRELLRVGLGGLGVLSLGGTVPMFVQKMAFAKAVEGSKVADDNILGRLRFAIAFHASARFERDAIIAGFNVAAFDGDVFA